MKDLRPIAGQLVSFSIPNGALAAKGLPDRLKILNWGDNKLIDGRVVKVGKNTAKLLPLNQAKLGFDNIALDYEHQTVKGHPNFQKDPIEVAAYGAPQVIEGEGLFLNIPNWTPSGQKNATNYIDLSPTPKLDENGEVVFLHSVALCRQGKVEGLTFYSADIINPASIKTLDSSKDMDYRAALLKLLKTLSVDLPDNPSDAEIADAAGKYKPDAEAETNAMSVVLKPVLDRLDKIETGSQERERQGLVTLASSHGKVIPLSADEIKTIPLTTLSSLIDKLPVTVPITERGKAKPDKKTGIEALSANQLEICKRMSLKPEDYLKTLNAEQPAHVAAL